MKRRESFLLHSSAVVLFVLAALNLLTASGSGVALDWRDPILQVNPPLGLTSRWVLVLCGCVELLVSAFLLAGKGRWTKLVLLVWLATCLMVYRMGLRQMEASYLGDAPGNYIDWFTLSPRTVGVVAQSLTALMLAGSVGFLLSDWWRSRKKNAAKDAKAAVTGSATQPAG